MKYLTAVVPAVVLSLLVGGCSQQTPPALAEAVFEYQLPEWPAEFVPCLSVDEKDVDPKVLEDIRRLRPEAVLGSACTYDMGGSYHQTSSRKAMLMDVKRLSSTEVQYSGRHAGKWADYIVFEVREDGGSWKVLRILKHEAA